ncbi:CYFA0S13e01222g1_1 [Cyberlindnera fabianii]|uniref:CYFA0S13e01222g1_1 n=1 Tax=Cyberlindnera fabianii TaxID=36022 RepID=A0A061BAQ2_CYBFA|nr:CYFA0S13e01222g1_1 [Cyberlindnera fabianii]
MPSFIAKFYKTDGGPQEIYNKVLFFAVFLFGILGCARGYDEGNIAGTVAQHAFKQRFGLLDENKTDTEIANLKSNITSMVQLGSIGGCLIAMYLVDKFGRIRTLQICCLGWIVGAIIQITSKAVGQLYAGRLIEGLAIGQTVVIGPCYLSEISPKNIRGLCNCIFAGAVYFGSFIANFANYGCAIHMSTTDERTWIVPTSLKIVLAGLLFIGSFFCLESPRWLVKVGKIDKSYSNLAKIRGLEPNHPYVLSEVSDIQEQLAQESAELGSISKIDKIRELVMVKSIRYRLLLGISAQILSQWSCASAITIYMPELVALVGVTGTKKLLYSSILGVVKFVGAYIGAFFLIDFLGRKRALYVGIIVQTLATLYYAIFLQVVPNATDEDYVMTGSEKQAGVGALAFLFIAGVGWTFGWNSIQYLINSEMLPLRVRNIGTALIMAFHFANQYGNTKAIPTMMISLTPAGTFFFAVGVLVLGYLWAWFFLPEISGRSLESMEELFNLPWYLVGRRGAELCPDNSGIAHIKEAEAGEIELKQSERFVENTSSDGKGESEFVDDLEKRPATDA